jgi:hypothetical protein
LWHWASHFTQLILWMRCKTEIPWTGVSMPGQAKDPLLLFFNWAQVGITGPNWHEIKTTVICSLYTLQSGHRRRRSVT